MQKNLKKKNILPKKQLSGLHYSSQVKLRRLGPPMPTPARCRPEQMTLRKSWIRDVGEVSGLNEIAGKELVSSRKLPQYFY